MRCIRFDGIGTRSKRRRVNKLAPIRNIDDTFNENIAKSYNCGEFVRGDEQLEAFRGRCSFQQYIPSKPTGYGVKIFSIVDNCSYCTSKLDIYC